MKKFIVIEGPEGSGKTTLLTNLQQRIPNSVVCKRPAKYREKILNSKGELRAAFWMFKDFLESDFLVRELLKTKHVFMDRYTYSTYLYQSYLLGISPEMIENFYKEEGLLKEDILIYLENLVCKTLSRLVCLYEEDLVIEGPEDGEF